MTARIVVQACELADQLLKPREETFAAVSGSPVDGTRDLDHQLEHQAVSCFERLLGVVSTLAPGTLYNTAHSGKPTWSGAPVVEEVSDQQSELDKEQLLVIKSCQAAALYAADAALLTPWSSHQLDLAARRLLKRLCAAMPTALLVPPHTASKQSDEQDLIAAVLPAILPVLSPALKFHGTHSISKGQPEQTGTKVEHFVRRH